MASGGGASLQPTFRGHVATTQDALILFEACLQGHLSHVPRRPHDRERSHLITSGSIFIYEENASGIKRWTDGVTWSPSRILGNFLVYRELDKPFPPGEKKRAMKKQQRRPSRPGEPYARPDGYANEQSSHDAEAERQLIGSLVDSYGFKKDGLVKKTMSVTVQGVTHHLVSYYLVGDVLAQTLRTPSQSDSLQYVRPRLELTQKQSFRAPLEDVDDLEGGQPGYGYRLSQAPQRASYGGEYNQQPYYPAQSYPTQAYTSLPPHTGVGPSYPVAVPPVPAPYTLQQPQVAPSHMQNHRLEYSQYDQGSYGRTYDPTSRSIPATPTSLPASMPPNISTMGSDRSQTQTGMYPPMSMQRPVSNMSPVSMDMRSQMPYRSSPYTPQLDQSRQTQASPIPDRREQAQPASHMYQSPRAPFYPEETPQQNTQGQYSQPSPYTQWPGPASQPPHPPQ
ncbi:uncharacterized protein PV06_03033 [Exophiala oligosperma]|uniref:Gti1/Pac2 family protein n=2 Tax=Chaetothyriales TaxID=34395 RepID=A0A0D2DP24_9EURO|nr:uncharacterized protein PV06_03033 [Exophiala oligosperma]KAJ9609258.1 Global transcription regulator sge1 [Knufia peltigerae]KIW44573.1 hypothetical protein PV06_03033 [Exophiala oligosperma]